MSFEISPLSLWPRLSSAYIQIPAYVCFSQNILQLEQMVSFLFSQHAIKKKKKLALKELGIEGLTRESWLLLVLRSPLDVL